MKDFELIFDAIEELPFAVGKKLLIDVLRANTSNQSILRNKLDKLECFGSMAYEEYELQDAIADLLRKGLLSQESVPGKSYFKVLHITNKGRKAKEQPLAFKKPELTIEPTVITDQERALFDQFDFFLGSFNDEQKKAITSNESIISCIAGAGSGKTTVLTKRIEFLTTYRSVDPTKILAITFTRKAKEEMEKRLSGVPQCAGVRVETFNSFCERLLRTYNNLIYERPVSVISYSEKIEVVKQALHHNGLTFDQAIDTYFTPAQRKLKSDEELMFAFINDCFTMRDYFKNTGKTFEEFTDELDEKDKKTGGLVVQTCRFVEEWMIRNGKRDFSDQITDTIQLFRKQPKLIPSYDHILVDEYQDVNTVQTELLRLLQPLNMFIVGDPRQAIYGWRGSKVSYIMDFQKASGDTITLVKNYRSSPAIVHLMNHCIREMKLPDVIPTQDFEKNTALFSFTSEADELQFILEKLVEEDKETFILARTNRVLKKCSEMLRSKQIPHLLRSEYDASENTSKITLATVHAIKGLEAERVFVMSASSSNFPCKASDHPILDAMKYDEYDRDEEELRLFYVAISRAKKELYITHTGSPSIFITSTMRASLEQSKGVLPRLQEWRSAVSRREQRPPYFIMHDSTMQEIAALQPATLEELEDIKGMGPLKIQKYGHEILGLF